MRGKTNEWTKSWAKRTCLSQWICELIACRINIWHSTYTLYFVNIYLSLFTPCNCLTQSSSLFACDMIARNNSEGISFRKGNKRTSSQMNGSELEQIWINLASNKYWQKEWANTLQIRKWTKNIWSLFSSQFN